MYQTIPTSRLDQLIDGGFSGTIVDLRNEASYSQSHIKGAINIPFDKLESFGEQLASYQPLLFYCSRGGQSMMACNRLAQKGFQVINVSNGISSYRGKYLVNG